MHSHNVQLNIPFCAEMNAESNDILQDMISQTRPKIRGVVTTPPPLGSQCHKKSLVALGLTIHLNQFPLYTVTNTIALVLYCTPPFSLLPSPPAPLSSPLRSPLPLPTPPFLVFFFPC